MSAFQRRPRRGPGIALLAFAALATLAGPPLDARAASKSVLALTAESAPGGGLFAGPGFTGWPAAAGSGWIAFRGEVAEGEATEAMIVAHMTPPVSRAVVASIGAPAPDGGTFRQFIGRPAVNANGDVAFLAVLTRDESNGDDPELTPAGIFLFHDDELFLIARSGQVTSAGTLDLLGVVDPAVDPNQVPERSPALNDAGEVAFLTGLADTPQASGAILLASASGALTTIVATGGPFDDGAFITLGPPALNNERVVAFHGITSTGGPLDPDGTVDGIFAASAGVVSVLVRDGIRPMPLNLPLVTFQDDVALNDAGDVAFLAGPLFDGTSQTPTEEESPGVIVYSAGVVTVVAHPGARLGDDGISSFRLGPGAGSRLVPPLLTPDSRVLFFASLNGGSREAVVLWNGTTNVPLAYTGGTAANTTPVGGVYAGAQSAPGLDAVGGVVFRARIAGGTASEAIVYRPPSGEGLPIVVGDSAPTGGFFGGRPFSVPLVNQQGDVVFRAYLAHGDASVGLFRFRDGRLESLVRAGDLAPGNGAPILDLVGRPSLNQAGALAFAAQVSGKGVGLFVTDAGVITPIAIAGDPAPGGPDAVFRSVGINPSINDAGAVAFRATVLEHEAGTDRRTARDGIFVADGTGIHPLVWEGAPSPVETPFFRLRDPVLTNAGHVAFRASLGTTREVAVGMFDADASGVTAVALERDELGANVLLWGLVDDPVAAASGGLTFLATRTRLLDDGLRRSLGPAIFRRTETGLGLVVARDMPGPAGGTFRNLTAPAVNALGHVAFRGSFMRHTGGTGGIFLATDAGIEPYLALGEATPGGGGRFSAFGDFSLNDRDDVAFTATVSGGVTRSGVFLASRSALAARDFRIRLKRRRNHDRIELRLVLRLGRLSDGIALPEEAITLTVTDATRTLWSPVIPGGILKRRGRAFAVYPYPRTSLGKKLSALRVTPGPRGTVRVRARSARLDLTEAGRTLEPPFAVTVQVGDDSGTRTLPCFLGTDGVRCTAE